MIIFCSAISLIIVIGHLASILRQRTYWPFDFYPMYSLPFSKLLYPVIDGESLTLFSLIDISDISRPRDLFCTAGTFPPEFHPFDKLDVSYLLVSNSPLSRGQKNKYRMEESTREFNAEGNLNLEKTLRSLIELARQNGSSISRLRLVQLRWENFRSEKAHFERPDETTILAEAGSASLG